MRRPSSFWGSLVSSVLPATTTTTTASITIATTTLNPRSVNHMPRLDCPGVSAETLGHPAPQTLNPERP